MKNKFTILLSTIMILGLTSHFAQIQATTLPPYIIGGSGASNGEDMTISATVPAISEVSVSSTAGQNNVNHILGDLTYANHSIASGQPSKVYQIKFSNNSENGYDITFHSDRTCKLHRLGTNGSYYQTNGDTLKDIGHTAAFTMAMDLSYDDTNATPGNRTYYGYYADGTTGQLTASNAALPDDWENLYKYSTNTFNNFGQDSDGDNQTMTFKFRNANTGYTIKHATFEAKMDLWLKVNEDDFNALIRGSYQDHIQVTMTDL